SPVRPMEDGFGGVGGGGCGGLGGSDMAERKMSTAVVGVGLAGAVVASKLTEAGCRVEAWDKGRGPGGRCSTRRSGGAGEGLAFDHGAQYLTANEPRFVAMVEGWASAGVVAEWGADGLVEVDALVGGDGGFEVVGVAPVKRRWVGVPGMSRIVSRELEGVGVGFERRVVGLARGDGGWSLAMEGGEVVGPYERVVLGMPAVQARGLLELVEQGLAERLALVEVTPCWAAMLVVEGGAGLEWVGAKVRGHEALSWVANDSSKPGRARDDGLECWVVHASPAWTLANLEIGRESAGERLAEAFGDLCEGLGVGRPGYAKVRAHRWLYAQTQTALGEPYLVNGDGTLWVCGDWMLGGKLEAAALSGLATAEAVLGG
ncbi:MAG: NAD(P)-binding protein, partial [Planctomycetota bacterium]